MCIDIRFMIRQAGAQQHTPRENTVDTEAQFMEHDDSVAGHGSTPQGNRCQSTKPYDTYACMMHPLSFIRYPHLQAAEQ